MLAFTGFRLELKAHASVLYEPEAYDGMPLNIYKWLSLMGPGSVL